MRLISQDGTVDLPYDSYCLNIIQFKGGSIVSAEGCHGYYGVSLATYSNEEKAKKALQMLHDALKSHLYIEDMEFSEEAMAILNKSKSSAIIAYTGTEKPKMGFLKGMIFRFPKDEEVEVQR